MLNLAIITLLFSTSAFALRPADSVFLVQKNMTEINKCADAAGPPSVTVIWTVGTSGEVTHIESRDHQDSPAVQCLVQTIRRLHVPSPTEAEYNVEMTFDLRRNEPVPPPEPKVERRPRSLREDSDDKRSVNRKTL